MNRKLLVRDVMTPNFNRMVSVTLVAYNSIKSYHLEKKIVFSLREQLI